MVKARISNFIKKHKNKIGDLGMKLIIVAIVVFIATILLSGTRSLNNEKKESPKDVYEPTKTIIQGHDVSEKQYEKDSNIVEKFLEYCNNKDVEQAYNLISEDCKDSLYPTLERFKTSYYEHIFQQQREYNLQSWISTNEYTVYKIRYTNKMLSTGTYQKGNIYQDYITLLKNTDAEKIALGTFIKSETLNKQTSTKEIQAKVIKKTIYADKEEYEIYIKNNTENTIKLDSLKKTNTIKLVGNSGGAYNTYTNELFSLNMIIKSGETNKLTIKFKKTCESNNNSKYIQFSEVIRNYDEYLKGENNYNDTFKVEIQL